MGKQGLMSDLHRRGLEGTLTLALATQVASL